MKSHITTREEGGSHSALIMREGKSKIEFHNDKEGRGSDSLNLHDVIYEEPF